MFNHTYTIDVISRKANGTVYAVSQRGGKNKLIDFLDGRNEVMEFNVTRHQVVLDKTENKLVIKKMAARAVSDDDQPMSQKTLARSLVECIVGLERGMQRETTIS